LKTSLETVEKHDNGTEKDEKQEALEAGAALQAAAQEIYKVQEGQERSPEQLLDAIREVLQIELGRTAAEKEQQTMSNKSNEDSLGLEPLYAGNFVIGFVDAVNGPGAREVPEFKPTRAELLELIKYWKLNFLETNANVFSTGQTGSTERRLGPYAARRVNRIVELLGEDAIKAVHEVRKKFATRVGSQKWEIFCAYLGMDVADGQ